MALGAIFSVAAPIVGGLIGKSISGSPPNLPYTGNISTNLANQQGAASQAMGLGSGAASLYNQFAGQEGQAVQNELGLLNSNPYTDSFSAAQLAGATSGNTAAFNAQRSGLTAQLAARGLGGGGIGGASSELAGGLAGIDAAQATSQSQAANSLAMNAIQQRYANLAQAAQLAQGYGNSLFSQGIGGLAQGGALYGDTARGYLGLGTAQQGVNQAFNQQVSQLGQGIGGLIGGIGGMAGGGMGGLGALAGLAGSGASAGSAAAAPLWSGSSDYSMPPVPWPFDVAGY